MATSRTPSPMVAVLRRPGPTRRFLLVAFQSSLGSAMAFVALLLVAYERFRSPWAVTLVLIAEAVPMLLLAPLFGKLADTWSRRRLVVGADVLRAGAFLALALVDSFAATLGLAVLAGIGLAMFLPAGRAALPTLAGADTDAAVGVLAVGWTVADTAGPALGALLLLGSTPETLLLVNAATFVVSALVLSRLAIDGTSSGPEDVGEPEEDTSIRAGLRAVRAIPLLALVAGAGIGATFATAFINVAEPLLATGPLGAGDAGYSLLVAAFGAGSMAGAALGAADARRMMRAVLAAGATLSLTGLATSLPLALAAFAGSGAAIGLMLACEARLLALLAPEAIQGRVYGMKSSLDAFAFLSAFVLSGALASVAGPRVVFLVAGVTSGLVAFFAFARLARAPPAGDPPPLPIQEVGMPIRFG